MSSPPLASTMAVAIRPLLTSFLVTSACSSSPGAGTVRAQAVASHSSGASTNDRKLPTCAPGEVLSRVAGCVRVVQLSAGHNYTCALLSSGKVMCWGWNQDGELGDGTTARACSPVVVQGLDDAVEIAAGFATVCARRRGGSIECWGLDLRADYSREPPEPALGTIVGLDDATGICVGGAQGCAVRSNGAVSCWSRDEVHGNKRTYVYQVRDIPGLRDVVEIGCGTEDCARTRTGEVWCWTITHDQAVPRRVPNVVAVGLDFSIGECARKADGRSACWGDWLPDVREEGDAKLSVLASRIDTLCSLRMNGDVDCTYDEDAKMDDVGAYFSPNHQERAHLGTLRNVASIAAGDRHVCALLVDGRTMCWGMNGSCQLGRPRDPKLAELDPGPLVQRPTPVEW